MLALAGCSPGSSASSAPTGLTGLSAYKAACKGTAVPQAAAYQGSGPHPIAFFLDGSNDGDGTLSGIDPDWAAPGSWSPSDAGLIQLVACIDITDNARSQDCGAYSVVPGAAGRTRVTLQWQNYTISLHQAKSGALVAKPIVLVGETGNKCPDTVQPTSSADTYTAYTTLSATQIQQALNKYVA